MHRFLVPTVILIGLAILAVGLLFAGGWEEDQGEPLSGIPYGQAEQAARLAALEEIVAAAAYARAERYRIVAELEAERISLDEAIEQFAPLNANDPVCIKVIRGNNPGHSDEEILGYQIAVFASTSALQPDRKAAFLSRLTDQLQARFGTRTLLPEVLR